MNKGVLVAIVVGVLVIGGYLIISNSKKGYQPSVPVSPESSQQESSSEALKDKEESKQDSFQEQGSPVQPEEQSSQEESSQGTSTDQKEPGQDSDDQSQAPTTQEENTVVYTDEGFSPNTLEIKKGESVIFKNESSRAMWPASDIHPTHRIYSGTSLIEHCGSDLEDTAFDACQGIQPGDFWSFRFEKAGTWGYHDHLRPDLTGTIVVR